MRPTTAVGRSSELDSEGSPRVVREEDAEDEGSEFQYFAEDDDHYSPLLPFALRESYEWKCQGGGEERDGIERDGYYEPSPALRGGGKRPKLFQYSNDHHHHQSSKLRRHHKLASLLRLATYFVVGCWVIAGFGVFGWAGWFFYTRHSAYAKSIFAFSLEPNPVRVEHLVSPFPMSNVSPTLSSIQQELDQRYNSLSLPTSAFNETGSSSLQSFSRLDPSQTLVDRYSKLPSSGPYLFALNLYNSQDVLPSLSRALLMLSDFLTPQNVHISIFENGSTDNTTMALAHLAAGLSRFGVEHTIVSDDRRTDWKKVDRIDQLAVYRNVALKPILTTGRKFEDVVFMNDVYVDGLDALELLYQRREQEADAVCGLDWRETKGVLSKLGKQSVKMYDSWVARSITGNMLRSRLDIWSEARNGVQELFNLEQDKPSRERFERGLPIPVYSCWNGMIALSAEPFRTIEVNPRARGRDGPRLHEGQSRFKPAKQVPTFRSALRSQGECAASECKTLAKDFWSRGYNRWVMIPTVRSTYSPAIYNHPHLISLVSRARTFLTSSAPERQDPFFAPKIDWSLPQWRAPKSVVCWDWVRGFHIDLEWLRMKKNKPW